MLPFLAIPFLVIGKRRKEASDNDVVGNKIKNRMHWLRNIWVKPKTFGQQRTFLHRA